MRKWICVGVLGGLLEFGIVYQIAFSGTDSPTPETVAETDGTATSSPRATKAGRNRRTTRHVAAAAGIAGTAISANPQAAETVAAKRVTTTPAPGAQGTSAESLAPASPAAGDPLGEILKTNVAAIVARPITLGLTGGAVPGPPVTIPDPLESARAEAEELAKAAPTPAPAVAPSPIDVGSLPTEDMIRHVFGPEGDKAVEVARCESTLRTNAKKGQFHGLFQLGANERADYGHGPDALAQVMAAHALFLDRGWQPWTCA